MRKINIPIDGPDSEYSDLFIEWFDDSIVCLSQEKRDFEDQIVVLTWSEAQQLRDALNRFLEERLTARVAALQAGVRR